MPPITRSATRQIADNPIIILNIEETGYGVIDMISIEQPLSRDLGGQISFDEQWGSILENLSGVRNCNVITKGRPPETSNMIWIFIEWYRSESRIEFLASDKAHPFLCALHQMKTRYTLTTTALQLLSTQSPILPIDQHRWPGFFYEILITYFPTDLPEKTISRLEETTPLYYGRLSIQPEFHPSVPMSGFLDHGHSWLHGDVNFEGKPARRLVHILKWRDQQGLELYKREQRTYRGKYGSLKAHTLYPAWEVFMDELEYHGMLGLESENVEFDESWSSGRKDVIFTGSPQGDDSMIGNLWDIHPPKQWSDYFDEDDPDL
ncbi:hypothetical protein BJY04DRAFT_194287 [Aspergillus karnatakaensis]|uniref:uncharacterized protein n=1 Tax=Aspergillus karnatakaensis TaxID=1810916 RepID=UPI003CCCE71C